MKKFLLSVLTVGIVAAGAIYATGAFFNDTETSTGNKLVAGAVDLKIDSKCSYNGLASDECGTFDPTDLGPTSEKFFNFSDLKPGDQGENTISLDLSSNPAHACLIIENMSDDDLGLTEPEASDGDATDGVGNGELSPELHFFAWADDGNNIWESGEAPLFSNTEGPASDVLGGKSYYLNVLQPGTTYLGVYWCFGNLTVGPGNLLTCDGSAVTNVSQTDSLTADLRFYVEQSRHNKDFKCPEPVQQPKVGAALGAYVKPTSCNVVVSNGGAEPNTITEGIANASDGQTVCVDAGIYNEDVVIDKEIKLSGDGATATSTINGQAGGYGAAVKIAANNVVLEGFEINGAGIAALWLNTGVSGSTFRYNKITSASGQTALTTQGSVGNCGFYNNEFVGNGASQLAYVNGFASLGAGQGSDSMDFINNTFSGTIVPGGVALGIESGGGSDVKMNVFESTLTSTYAIAETWEWSVIFNQNNFNGVGGVKVRNSNAAQVNGENNWWGAAVPAGHIIGNVDDNPKAAAAFPEN